MPGSVAGKTVAITGSAGGIGSAGSSTPTMWRGS